MSVDFKQLTPGWKDYLIKNYHDKERFISLLDFLYCIVSSVCIDTETNYHNTTMEQTEVEKKMWLGLPNGELFKIHFIDTFENKKKTHTTYYYQECFHLDENGQFLLLDINHPHILEQFSSFCLAQQLDQTLPHKDRTKLLKI